MRSSFPRLGFLTILLVAACGGRVGETSGDGEGTAAPPRESSAAPSAPAVPETVAEGIGTPSALVLVGDQAVFTTSATKVGGEVIATGALFLADPRFGKPLMLALDRQGATWDSVAANARTAWVGTSDGRIVEVPMRGGVTRTIAKVDGAVIAVVLASRHVYFATDEGIVARVPEAGGEVEALGSMPGGVRALAADAAAAYVAASSEGRASIVRFAPNEEPQVLAETDHDPCGLARVDDRLFWTTLPAAGETEGTVLRLPIAGGTVDVVARGTFAACAIAADANHLYFATSAPRGLMRAPFSGGGAAAIGNAMPAQTDPGTVAVDGHYLYWLTDSAVMRVRK